MVNHTFYVRAGDEDQYQKFQKVCDREGESVSEKIANWIRDYMASHGEGNPQTILDYAGKPKTLPLWKTCLFSQKMRVKGEIYCNPVRRRGHHAGWKIVSACTRCNIYEPEASK